MKRMVAGGQIRGRRLRWFAVVEGFDGVSTDPAAGSVLVIPDTWPRRRFRGRG